MIRHLTAADYRPMRWGNGRGTTLELLRIEGPEGLRLRLSRATVAEAGPFSVLPAIERNLTVVTGPGFRIVGDGIALHARPLEPVAFPGDVALGAVDVTAASDDFNVMTARALPRPDVRALSGRHGLVAGTHAVYALGPARVAGLALGAGELLLTDEALVVEAPVAVIVVQLGFALP